jgi:transcriptional regulator with XRE-family HTH domain
MPRERIPPRQRLAKNLRVLAAKTGMSGTEIGRKASVDQKTVTEMMKASFDPRLSKVEKVANVFGLAAWQLLAYDLEERPPDSAQVVRLLEHYTNAEDAGRKAIMQVAEVAAEKAG